MNSIVGACSGQISWQGIMVMCGVQKDPCSMGYTGGVFDAGVNPGGV